MAVVLNAVSRPCANCHGQGFLDSVSYASDGYGYEPEHETADCGRCWGSGVEPSARELTAREEYADARVQDALERVHDGCYERVVREAVFDALGLSAEERAALETRDRQGQIGDAVSEAIITWVEYGFEPDQDVMDTASSEDVPLEDIPF